MRKILTLLLVVTAINSYSQSIVVEGYINNAQGNPVNLSIDKTYLGVGPEVFTSKTSEGNFSFLLNKKSEFLATLIYGTDSCSFFLEPNDTLNIAFTTDLLNSTMQLAGNAAAKNIFLKNFAGKFADNFNDTLMSAKMLSTGVDAFEIDLFNTRKKEIDFFRSDSSYSKFTPAFKTYFTNLVNYRYWNLLLAYPIINANSSTSILRVDELPEPLLDGLDKVKVNNADALICSSYRSFLKYYIIYFTSKQNGFNKFTDYNISMDKKNVFAQSVLSGTPYQYWLSRFILDDYEKAQPSTVKRLYTTLLLSNNKSIYSAVVKEKCGAYMEKKDEPKVPVAPSGKLSADAACKIVNEKGKPVRFSDFKGKVVYVDFWASWCGPCRGEMPHSKELHHRFTEKQLKNIVFLYISIDKSEAAWRKAVTDIGMEGYQGWSAADWPDGAGSLFQVNSIPRYLLIDKSGNLVDDNAKRPSDPAVYDDIINLLR